MNVRFYMDPLTGSPHVENHSVTMEEVEDILREPGEDRPGREGSRVAIGQTEEGKYLKVIYVPDPEGVFVITAFEFAANRSWLIVVGAERNRNEDQILSPWLG